MDKLGLNLPGLIAQFVNFGILLFILWKFVLPPVQKMLDERRRRIEESLEAADRARTQAVDTERRVQEQLEESRTQGRQLVVEAQAIANRIREDARTQANEETEQLKTRALADIQLERDNAIASLRREFADITVSAAEKVINQSLDRNAHQRLIEQALAESGIDR
ncbi:MAG: F0F1 ATP synthase subunit B [Chloroflexi bacterium]|nr:F0F1 ATP synthase subunit B [Chloroflexota bacterium]